MYKRVKIILDFVISLVLLIILSPVMIVTILILTIANKGNPFFIQVRPGKNEKLFNVIKFKTMNEKTDDGGQLLPDAERLHFFGKLVRKTSIDELPQLINILKGDMSLIGPRPLLVEYLPRYSAEQRKRHKVRPGISGWAQVNGRNAISWEGKFKFDVWYVENISFLLDIKIFWLTIFKIFLSEGVSKEGHATCEKFEGNMEHDK